MAKKWTAQEIVQYEDALGEKIKYPNIKVRLTGTDGNAFAILGVIKSALIKNKVPATEVKAFLDEAMSSDYNHLLATCMRWVSVR